MPFSDQIIMKFFDYGIFAVLFLILLWWVLKTNNEREQRYIEFIGKMTERLDLLGTIAETLQALKQDLDDLHDKIDRIEREMWKKGGDEDE